MFEKLARKVVKKTTKVVKQEAAECLDDNLSILVGCASLIFLVIANCQTPKPVSSNITINNYYLGRR